MVCFDCYYRVYYKLLDQLTINLLKLQTTIAVSQNNTRPRLLYIVMK